MPDYLCLSVRFLDPTPSFHGRGGAGEPEWPPSPLRLFQALTDAAAHRWRDQQFREYAEPTLKWLERQDCAVILTPDHHLGVPHRLAVPNNDMDSPAAAWAAGREPAKPHRPVDLRTMKAVHRVRMLDREKEPGTVYYLYPLPDAGCPYQEVLSAAAGGITHFGWGVDMVAAGARVIDEEKAAGLPGQRWREADGAAGDGLRVPVAGTLDDLTRKHAAFLGRLTPEGFRPVPPLTRYRVVGYRRATDPTPVLAYTAFRILSADPDAPPPSFDAARRARDVACWVRHAAGRVCDPADAVTFVHGHDPADPTLPAHGPGADDRLLYLPLPTINPKLNRAEAIRRVLVAGPVGSADRVRQVGRRLEGADLVWDGRAVGVLAPLPASDWVLRQYTAESTIWSTVTPVILPGHDDRDERKAEGLLRKAFGQAGLPAEVIQGVEELSWRNVGFRPGVDLASRYERPDKLTGRRCHVRVRFPVAVQGPLAAGAGRYRGLGVFAAERSG